MSRAKAFQFSGNGVPSAIGVGGSVVIVPYKKYQTEGLLRKPNLRGPCNTARTYPSRPVKASFTCCPTQMKVVRLDSSLSRCAPT